MAEVYGVDAATVLPVRGALHGVDLALRLATREGRTHVAAPPDADIDRLIALHNLTRISDEAERGIVLRTSPDPSNGTGLGDINSEGDNLVIVDESLIEFSTLESLASLAVSSRNCVVIRSLEIAYGLAGAPCAALIANPELIARLASLIEPRALSNVTQSLALAALDPTRAAAYARRFTEVRGEKIRVTDALRGAGFEVRESNGPFATVPVSDAQTRNALRHFKVSGAWLGERTFRLDIGAPETNQRALAAFGILEAARASRRAEIVRKTSETDIVVQLDLDSANPPAIDTGTGFFDHMLAQIATHGGFSLALSCKGDLEIDAHHTVEDCALALGQALREALGERRGIARFGFLLPMDESEARVSIDLSGRPYLVFDGAFTASHLGAYPTEMTEHVFRSLAQSMGAAIHVSVTGENDHHKTEACFKAFGRALRQAIKIEGEVTPSTKGALL